MDLVKTIYKPWTTRVARRVLVGRPRSSDAPERGRFTRREVDGRRVARLGSVGSCVVASPHESGRSRSVVARRARRRICGLRERDVPVRSRLGLERDARTDRARRRACARVRRRPAAGRGHLGGVSSEDAVAIALWNSPAFQAELAQLGIARADLAEAGALPNPTLSPLLPVGTRAAEASVVLPVAWLWHRPYRVAAAKLDVERTARGLVQTGLDLIRDVRVAHADALLAEGRASVLAEVADTAVAIGRIAAARTAAGEGNMLDRNAAAGEAALAQEGMRRANATVVVARARLALLLGTRGTASTATLKAKSDLDPPGDESSRRSFTRWPARREAGGWWPSRSPAGTVADPSAPDRLRWRGFIRLAGSSRGARIRSRCTNGRSWSRSA